MKLLPIYVEQKLKEPLLLLCVRLLTLHSLRLLKTALLRQKLKLLSMRQTLPMYRSSNQRKKLVTSLV